MVVGGNIIDIKNRRIFGGEIYIENGQIIEIRPQNKVYTQFILPGFVDAHVHIESSMLVPSEFARLAVVHGTVATVSDPHEIANVLGVKGVQYMIENGNQVPLKFCFGAPSCVPATPFETAGAIVTTQDIEQLFASKQVGYLAEMMNYPGVLMQDKLVMEKIALAQRYGMKIDGHAPGLRGEKAKQYIAAGIETDHECVTYDEAREKLEYGMQILIREGSAAKNFEALIDLLPEFYSSMMFCSDDKHPDDLILGHINQLVARAIARGLDLFQVLQVACLNPVLHYGLKVGLLREGDPADFIVVQDLENFKVQQTFIDGVLVAQAGKSLIEPVATQSPNNFSTQAKSPRDFELVAQSQKLRVIEALDGELITRSLLVEACIQDGLWVSDVTQDVLKIAVVNRYQNTAPSVAFIRNFGLKEGAIASCVGHDSHNIIAVGVDDVALCRAVNLIIEHQGGISAVGKGEEQVLPLPVAGIMSNEDGYTVGQAYAKLDAFAKSLGSSLGAPFMTLSFMALLVIPSLKLSDKGLFDGDKFEFVSLEAL